MKSLSIAPALLLFAISSAALADAPALTPNKAAFRALYKELVETNTTLSSGSCTLAAERMAAHLKAVLVGQLDLVERIDPATLLTQRYDRLRRYGAYKAA